MKYSILVLIASLLWIKPAVAGCDKAFGGGGSMTSEVGPLEVLDSFENLNKTVFSSRLLDLKTRLASAGMTVHWHAAKDFSNGLVLNLRSTEIKQPFDAIDLLARIEKQMAIALFANKDIQTISLREEKYKDERILFYSVRDTQGFIARYKVYRWALDNKLIKLENFDLDLLELHNQIELKAVQDFDGFVLFLGMRHDSKTGKLIVDLWNERANSDWNSLRSNRSTK